MIEEMITQAQVYVSQRSLPWSLAAIGLVVGLIFIRTVDHHLGKFFSTVGYDRTLEILCQRSVKWFLWIVLISLIAGKVGFNVSGFIAGLSVTGFVVGFAVKDVLANFAGGNVYSYQMALHDQHQTPTSHSRPTVHRSCSDPVSHRGYSLFVGSTSYRLVLFAVRRVRKVRSSLLTACGSASKMSETRA